MSDELDVLMSELDELGQAPTGKGVYCQALIEKALTIMVKKDAGIDQAAKTVTYTDAASREAGMKKLQGVLKNAGLDPNDNSVSPKDVIQFTMFRETAVGKNNWQGDLVKSVSTKMGKNYNTLLKPALEAAIKDKLFSGFGKKYWVHMKIVPDVDGRMSKTERDDAGNPKPEMIWYSDQFFANEPAMKKAAEEAGAENGGTGSNGNGKVSSEADLLYAQLELTAEEKEAILANYKPIDQFIAYMPKFVNDFAKAGKAPADLVNGWGVPFSVAKKITEKFGQS